jgi:hypothetical protein
MPLVEKYGLASRAGRTQPDDGQPAPQWDGLAQGSSFQLNGLWVTGLAEPPERYTVQVAFADAKSNILEGGVSGGSGPQQPR